MEELAESKLMAKPKKTSEGKKKIDLTKKVLKKTNRQVMFSKRRKGLFKKCDELCYKHGAQIGLITFSECGNLFPYGNPNLDSVVKRYLNCSGGSNLISNTNDGVNYCGSGNVGGNCGGFWWDGVEVDNLGLGQLEDFKVALEGLKNEIVSRVNNSLERSRNEVVSSVDDIKFDFSMSNEGIGLDDFDFGDVVGGTVSDQFGSDFDFDFDFGDFINCLGPEAHDPDASLLQHLQVN